VITRLALVGVALAVVPSNAAIAAARPRGTSDASYDTFPETFTLAAASWASSTASIDVTKPVAIKYVAQFNPDASAA
jgi:hypothetical protein